MIKKIKIIILTLVATLLFSPERIFTQTVNLVDWISLDEAVKKQQETPKTIFIDMYTDWCGWCKRMDETTFSDPVIARYINDNFYPVKFNAERTDTLEYMGNIYVNEGTGRRSSHQLAQLLMGGRMSYPTIVYIDEEFRVYPVPGYMDPARIEPLLVYFAEGVNNNCDFTDFERDYKNTFDQNFSENIEGEVNWIDFDRAMQKMENEPKKLILFINSDFMVGSKLMVNSVFKHPVISRYLNDDFYTVLVDFDTKDTLQILGNTFVNEKNRFGYPHQLTIALLRPDIRFPAMVFLDSNSNLIFALRGYYPPKVIEKYLNFISQQLYKTENWEEFNKKFQSEID